MTPIPAQYTKRPVTVEAARLEGGVLRTHTIYQWVKSHVGSFDPDMTPPPTSGIAIDPGTGNFMIATLEGVMTASLGDWIIRGVAGEFYPCKHEIFTATYQEKRASTVVDRAIDTVARAIVARLPRGILWEDYPELGEHDWEALVKRVDELTDGMAPSPTILKAALDLLASRADNEQDL